MSTETQIETPVEESVSEDVLAHFDELDRRAPAAPGNDAAAAPAKTAAPAAKTADAGDEAAAKQLELRQEEKRRAAREADKQAREEQQKAARAEQVAAFRRDTVGHLREIARQVLGDKADDKAIADFLAEEVYTPLMVEIAEVKDPDKLDPNIKTRAEMRKLERKFEAEKAAREAQLKELEAERENSAREAQIQQAKGTLTRWLEGGEREKYPHLMALADDPASELVELLLDDEQRTPEKAAELANDFYRKQHERFQKASDQLLGGRKTTAAGPPATKGPNAIERPSLTNSGATQGNAASADEPPDDPDASAAYWADKLERDPESLKKLVKRR